MNAERRKEIDRAAELIEQAQQILAVAAEEEQDCFDNIQGGEKGERANEAAEALEEVATNMADAMETLEEAKA